MIAEQHTLPKDWKWVKLEEIVSLLGDGLHGTPQYSENGEFFFINGNNLSDGKILIKENTKRVSLKEYEKYKKPLNDKTILVSINGTIGNVAFYKNEKVILGKSACYFNIIDNVDKSFIRFLLTGQRFLNYAHNTSTGSTIKNVSLKSMREFQIPLPPKPTQQAIVSKIEELFSELNKGLENLRFAQQQLKTYRQAVLKWGFEGKLTEKWREKNTKIKNALTLLNEIKKSRETKAKDLGKKLKQISSFTEEQLSSLPALPSQWKWIKLVETVFNTADDIVDGPFGSNLKNSDYVEGAPVPVISISNIEEGFDKKIRYITYEKFETIKRSAVYPGDVIVAKIGSTYGKTGVYPEWMPVGVIPANLLRIRPSNHFSKKLLIYYLKSAVFKKRLDGIMKSTAQPAYNVSMFKDLPIPFMSIEEQNETLQEIESRLSVADKIDESLTQSLQQAEALRQSILKKAFEGRLL